MEIIRIAHLSDTHISPSDTFNRTAFEIAIERINNSNVDIVIHTGDVTDQGLKDEFEYASFLLRKIKKPLIVIPGNHDVRNVGYKLFQEKFPGFKKSICLKFATFIPVDTTIPDISNGRIEFYEMERLKSELQKAEKKSLKIVIGHHHLLPVSFTGRERNVIHNGGDLLELLLSQNAHLYICGHKHVPNVYQAENLTIINAGCVSCRKTRKGDINSYNIIKITKEKDREKISVTTEFIDGKTTKKQIFINARNGKEKRKGKKLLSIIQISNSCVSDRFYFKNEIALKGIALIQQLNPDYVIHCGNIVDIGIERYFKRAAALFKKIHNTFLSVPGVNDFSYNGDIFYKKTFSTKIIETETVKILPIITAQKDNTTGSLGITGLELLKEQLKTKKEKIVYLHHNLIPIPRNRENGYLEDAGDIIKTLVENNVKLVMTGFGGNSFFLKIENTVFANAGSFSWELHRNPHGYSFNSIELFTDRVSIKEINILSQNTVAEKEYFYSPTVPTTLTLAPGSISE
ncbi:metallophosphoesterase family protein [Desulfurobacterium sp.]